MTIKEIAKLARVSRGTVDRVLHERGNVNPETERLIHQLVREYDYNPNRAGRALALSKVERKIGVILGSGSNPFFGPVISGMRTAVQDHAEYSVSMKLCDIGELNAENQIQKIDELLDEGCTALILRPVDHPLVMEKIRALKAQSIPVININTDVLASERYAYVGCDYLKSGLVAGQLMSLFTNHEASTCIIIGYRSLLGHMQRLQGFQRACEEYRNIRVCHVLVCEDDEERSYSLIQKLLQKEEGVNAFYFAAAGLRGGLRAIEEHAGELPIIIACDESSVSVDAMKRGVIQAIVSQEPYRQGYEAVRLSIEAMLSGDKAGMHDVIMDNVIKIKQNL